MKRVSAEMRSLAAAACGFWTLLAGAWAQTPSPNIAFSEDPYSSQVSLNLEIPAPSWEEAGGAWYPSLGGFGRMGRPGFPDLPALIERIALPPEGSLEIIEVQADWSVGKIPGVPAPFPARDPGRPPLEPSITAEGGWWPEEPAAVTGSGGAFRALRFATLEIRPLQVDVREGTFRVARSLKVRLRRVAPLGLASAGPVADRLTEEMAGQVAWGAGSVGRSPLAAAGGAGAEVKQPGTLEADSFPAWQVEVAREGLYRLDYATLAAGAPGLLGQDPRRWRMSVQGVFVPIQIDGEADGIFNPGDLLYFYGQPVGDIDLFSSSPWQHGDYTDTNIYRIDLADQPPRLQDAPLPVGNHSLATAFRESVHHEINNRFTGFVPAQSLDHWYIEPLLSANGSPVFMDQFVTTPDHAGGSVGLRVLLLGTDYQNNYHRTRLEVDGTVRDTQDWDGFREFTHGATPGPVNFTPPAPLSGSTKVTVRLPLGRSVNGTPITRDEVRVNWIELDYDRLFRAAGDALLWQSDNADREIRLDNFSSLPLVWDLGRTTVSAAGQAIAVPRRVPGVTWASGQAVFDYDADGSLAAKRRFVAAAGSGFLTLPAGNLRQDLPPSSLDAGMGNALRDPARRADWVVVGYRDFLGGPRLAELAAHRRSQGLETAIIDIQDVYDEFSFGLEDPQALRDFMAYAVGNWAQPPSYLLLVGDATRDYKGYYGHAASRQFVPTSMWDLPVNSQFGYYPSDTWFTAVVGDDPLPDVMVGRIASHTLAESEAAFQKTVQYETGAAWSPWKGKTCLVSEYEKDSEGNQLFFRVNDEIFADWFTGATGPQTATKAYELLLDEDCKGSGTPANNRIDACVNNGAALVTFVGHGQYRGWGKTCSLFDVTFPGSPEYNDLDDLVPTSALGFHIHANCITGHFPADTTPGNPADTWYSFLEAWTIAAGKAAIGGLAPSHLTYYEELDTILDPVFLEIFGKSKQRQVASLDARMRQDFFAANNIVGVRSFILFGDPALKLALPLPGPPGPPAITTFGNGSLKLTWQASADPSVTGYRVYRAEGPQGPYASRGDTTGLSFVDSGLTNCLEYYYFVVALDARGWESRWSNSNEDCATHGPQCRSGSAQNPAPPHPPTGVAVTDPRLGGRLQVTWNNADRESDVLRYTVYWGLSPGVYTFQTTTTAKNSSQTIGGLDDGVTYFVAVAAEHCTLSSAFSQEVTGVPHLVRGINPPRSIGRLMVERKADPGDGIPDLRLSWPLPTDSVWGVETTVTGFEVYGATTGPQFRADPGRLLASLSPGTLEWYHENLGTPASPRWYYIVAAVDANGNRSAFGVEAPEAVDDLVVSRPAAGTLFLDWSPVEETMDHRRLTVARYHLYGAANPFTRAQCTADKRLPLTILTPGVSVSEPSGPLYCYQVLPEDTHGTEAVW